MSRYMWKRTFGHVRPEKIQIRLRSLIRISTGRILIAKDAKFLSLSKFYSELMTHQYI